MAARERCAEHVAEAAPPAVPARRHLRVHGLVQGVGYRPFVHTLAARFGIAGFVRNESGSVVIEAQAPGEALDAFEHALRSQAPARARITAVESVPRAPREEHGFRIEASQGGPDLPVVAADLAACDDCLREILDPADRRYGHAFASCAACGPRYTLITGAPYDRERTTMAGFAMCARCRDEYEDPADRRFHAQTMGCPDCGPELTLLDAAGLPVTGADPLALAARALRDGRIVAIKGLGGYHLACDARSQSAVAALRARKQRQAKPFAIMVADLAAAQALATLNEAEAALLASPERPVVLLSTRPEAALAPGVAPGLQQAGVMLAYTPLHALLTRAAATPRVKTRGNRSQAPLAFEDADARSRRAGIADLFLTHDRPIHARCDDSVARIAGGQPLLLRRARGHAPMPHALPRALAMPTLATGGELKAVFALGTARSAVASGHHGDLGHAACWDDWQRSLAQLLALHALAPRRIVHDLHPDYATTRWARAHGLPCIGVQHHHAHIASCMAEHGLAGEVIGVAFDGSGYGPDGTVWGGEFLLAGYAHYRRAAHLRCVPLPGGEQAVREPWRMALAHACDAGAAPVGPSLAGADTPERGLVLQMIERRLNAPLTSSIGRLFDAIASIAGLCQRTQYEAQAAMLLEEAAVRATGEEAYAFAFDNDELDPRPVILEALADARAGVEPGAIARRFHLGLAQAIADTCARLRDRHGHHRVALGGGVFCNALLTSEATRRLAQRGFEVFRPQAFPPNDGGLALGQLAVAAGLDALGAA